MKKPLASLSPMCCLQVCSLVFGCVSLSSVVAAEEPRTTLANPQASFKVSTSPAVTLRRGPITALVINNEAGGELAPQHRAGYSGVAALHHEDGPKQNLFVPSYAGLNYEHIHDGTNQHRDVLFEPRRAPMETRILDAHTVELYQAPTPHWGLESSLRYHLLPDGAIEMTLECIPRKRAFAHDYIGLFWASYIQQPGSLDIHFRGRTDGGDAQWIRGVTPRHGVLSTHPHVDDDRNFAHEDDFALTLVFNRSKHRYVEPWYFGVCRDMAFVQMFRPQDRIRLTQSPSGGGQGNPAWDFQFFIPDYQVGRRYRMVMRAAYIPYESADQVEKATRRHRAALAEDTP